MRRNASTVVVLPGPAPAEVLAAVGRSMNVALIRPPEPADDDDGFEAAAGALQQAGRSTSAYALVPLVLPVPRPATRGRTSTLARCGPPGRNGWPW